MNNLNLIGRLTKEPVITTTQQGKTIARFTLAVDRIGEGADFISCVAFDKTAQVIEKYCSKGTKIAINGRIQTGSYNNRDGQTIYTTDVIITNMEFCESKKGDAQPQQADGFTEIPDDFLMDESLPF